MSYDRPHRGLAMVLLSLKHKFLDHLFHFTFFVEWGILIEWWCIPPCVIPGSQTHHYVYCTAFSTTALQTHIPDLVYQHSGLVPCTNTVSAGTDTQAVFNHTTHSLLYKGLYRPLDNTLMLDHLYRGQCSPLDIFLNKDGFVDICSVPGLMSCSQYWWPVLCLLLCSYSLFCPVLHYFLKAYLSWLIWIANYDKKDILERIWHCAFIHRCCHRCWHMTLKMLPQPQNDCLNLKAISSTAIYFCMYIIRNKSVTNPMLYY